MEFDESEASAICDFIKSLNSVRDGVVVVEGKKDEEALNSLGFSGRICQFHKFKGLARFADWASRHKRLILLLDSDRKGAYLTRRIISMLEHRVAIDLSYRRKLVAITRGKIRHVEDLSAYKTIWQ